MTDYLAKMAGSPFFFSGTKSCKRRETDKIAFPDFSAQQIRCVCDAPRGFTGFHCLGSLAAVPQGDMLSA